MLTRSRARCHLLDSDVNSMSQEKFWAEYEAAIFLKGFAQGVMEVETLSA